MCQNCNQNNCGGCTEVTNICNECQSEQLTCDCPISDLSTDCVLFNQDSILYGATTVVPKNTILSVALDNIVQFIKVRIEEVQNRFKLINTGVGASIYSGMNLLGEKKLRKLKSTNGSVTITEGTDDINFSVAVVVAPDGSETKVNAGSNVSVTGNGTITTPYVINATDLPEFTPLDYDLEDFTNVGADPFIHTSEIQNFVPYIGAVSDVNLGEFGIQLGNLEFDLTPTNIPTNEGSLVWNNTDGTLDLKLKGNNVTLQIGQETVLRVVNKTSPTIDLLESNYQVVRITGAQGQRPKVDLALADSNLNSTTTIGIVTETIPINQEGFITTSGQVKQINTTGSLQGETWVDGDVLYLSGTVEGGITNIKPAAPIHTIIIGIVEYAHNTNGKIFVKVDNGYELEELHNVSLINPLDKEVLTYESLTGLWKNKLPAVLFFNPTTLISANQGQAISGSENSIFLGIGAGEATSNIIDSNFIGLLAGKANGQASNSNFFGRICGRDNQYANDSNFFGYNTGTGNINVSSSNFMGRESGVDAFNANNSNFFGQYSGKGAINAGYSTLMGFQVGMSYVGNELGSNNIIIGTNISLPNLSANRINLGGVIFATNTNSDISGNPKIAATALGRVQIGSTTDNGIDRLQVTGSGLFSGEFSKLTLSNDANGYSELYGDGFNKGINFYGNYGGKHLICSADMAGPQTALPSFTIHDMPSDATKSAILNLKGYATIYRDNFYDLNLRSANAIFMRILGGDGYFKTYAHNMETYAAEEYSFVTRSTKEAGASLIERMTISRNGNIGIYQTVPTTELDVTGTINATQYKISALNTAPASSTATGTLGEIRITATYIYVCTATNTWVRTSLTTWI